MSKFLKVSKADYYARIFSGHGPERLEKVLPFPGAPEDFGAICVRNLVWEAQRKTV